MKKELKVLLCRGVAVRRLITGAFAGLLLMFFTSYLNATIWTVTNCNDSGSGSLRDAIAAAGTHDTINFSPATNGDTIVLSGTIPVYQNINIIGNGPDKTIIDGNQKGTVLKIKGSIDLENLTVKDGSAVTGGGIVNTGITTINNCVISRNYSTVNGYGGGIYNTGTLTLENSVITNNYAAWQGAGIYNSPNATLTLTNCTVSNNSSTTYVGGILNDGGSLTMDNTTVNDNKASNSYGGIFNTGTAVLTNSTITNNTARVIAGICNNSDGNLDIISCIVANNKAAQDSSKTSNGSIGGIFNIGTLLITNTICTNNYSSKARDDFFNNGSVTDNGYNIIGAFSGPSYKWAESDWTLNNGSADAYTEVGTGTTGQILLASSLTYNGGANLTLVPGAGSIAIGNGTDSGIPNTDQRGYIRKSTPDIGAYETNGIVAYNGNTPYTSIQSAIDVANPKDTIELIPTQIKESGINVNKNVIIEGAGADTTYVQADLTPGTATDRIFNITSGATLDSMTIRNGDTSGIGGGMLCTGTGTAAINNCVVSDNIASEGGGGIANTDGTLNLLNSMVLDNQSTALNGNGGGILCKDANIQNSTIASNHSYGNGGGIEGIEYSNATNITNCTIFGNSAAGTGGGADFSGSNIIHVLNSTIAGNSSATGAGINVNTCNLFTATNSIIANNIGLTDFNTYDSVIYDYNYNVVGASNNPKMWVGNGDWLDQNNTGTFTNGTKQGQLFLANALADNGGPTLTLIFTDPSSIAVYQAIPRGITNFNFSPNTDQRGVVRTGNYTAIGAFNDNQSGN